MHNVRRNTVAIHKNKQREMSFNLKYSFALILHHVLYVLMFTQYQTVKGTTYTAGVVEFAPEELSPPLTPQDLILVNAAKYDDVITVAAKHGVDILVFPECGLTSINIPPERIEIFPFLTEIPDVGFNPCDATQTPEVLRKLSCAAKDKKLYLVINLSELKHCNRMEPDCSSDGYLFYNTNIAFDRNGTIVAKYRKYNLFIEPGFNTTMKPDVSWFDTDFGVRFGMSICFDILFHEPSESLLALNISNFVYSTAWFSELPFLTAVSVQSAWAYENDVNFLASGYSNTTRGVAGSGIYAGRDGKLVAIYPDHSSTKLLMTEVSSNQRGKVPHPPEVVKFKKVNNTTLTFFHQNLENFTTIEVTNETKKLEYKKGGFNCAINVLIATSGKGPKFRLVAFSGLRTYGIDRTVMVEVCGVVACADTTLSSCSERVTFHAPSVTLTNISINVTSDNKRLISYPITLDEHLLSLPNKTFQYRGREENNKITLNMNTAQPPGNIIAFTIFRNSILSTDNLV